MQKLDFVKNLEVIVDKLMSGKVVNLLIDAVRSPQSIIKDNGLSADLFAIKANYDTLMKDKKYSEILENLYPQVLVPARLPKLVITLSGGFTAIQLYQDPVFAEFFDFHNTLLQTLNFARAVLVDQEVEESLKIENGIIVFEVLIGENPLSPESYSQILVALSELIQAVGNIEGENEQPVELVLLDSGSNTNFGIKTGVETAKTVVQLFREVLDFITKRRFMNFELENKALIDSLSVREKIIKAQEKGIISEEDAKVYVHSIKTRTDKLIRMHVAPKTLIDAKQELSMRTLLSQGSDTHLLTEGQNSENQ